MSENTEAVDELAAVLRHHLTDSDERGGCALRCGYNGDDRARHLAEAILASRVVDIIATEQTAAPENSDGNCSACWHCRERSNNKFAAIFLCPECGDKRCARALDHRAPCDNTNIDDIDE